MGPIDVLPGLILLAFWIPSVTPDSDGYSFRFPGRSYIEYHPHWTNFTKWGFAFTFRTHKANTFLFLHEFLPEEKEKPLQASIGVRLKKGHLCVTHTYMDDIQETIAGKGEIIYSFL